MVRETGAVSAGSYLHSLWTAILHKSLVPSVGGSSHSTMREMRIGAAKNGTGLGFGLPRRAAVQRQTLFRVRVDGRLRETAPSVDVENGGKYVHIEQSQYRKHLRQLRRHV
jgi:hypothetical protein